MSSGPDNLPPLGRKPCRKSELALVLCFLAILGIVPVTQTFLELARGQRVQAADVFRYRPTAANLRQFERTLEEKSWVQQHFRPVVQQTLFHTVGHPGSKAVVGLDDWLFYRPDLRYLVEPDRVEEDVGDSRWVTPSDGRTRRDSVVRCIVRFRNQLRERGIQLLVVPVPGKASVYPDRATRREIGRVQEFRSPTLELIERLDREGVVLVDLFAAFRRARARVPPSTPTNALYLAQDTHWTPAGAGLAARVVADKLRLFGWAPAGTREFRSRVVPVDRSGDIIDMMQIPAVRETYAPETVQCEQISDPALGLLVPTGSERPGAYRFPGEAAPILVLGDSFSRIYQFPEPHSLGRMVEATAGSDQSGGGTRRLLPGSAGFISLLAFELKSPVDAIVSEGGASTDVRRKLATNPEILEGKKVVVWEFVERDIGLGRTGWEDVALPPRL